MQDVNERFKVVPDSMSEVTREDEAYGGHEVPGALSVHCMYQLIVRACKLETYRMFLLHAFLFHLLLIVAGSPVNQER